MVPSAIRERAHTPSNGSESCSRPPNLKLGCGEGSLDHVKLIISAREPTPYSVRLGAQQASTHLRPPSTHFSCPSNRHDSHTNGEGVHRRRQAAGPSGSAVGDLPPLLSHFLSLPWTGCSLPSSPSRIGPAPCGAASSSRGQQTFRHQRSGYESAPAHGTASPRPAARQPPGLTSRLPPAHYTISSVPPHDLQRLFE